MSSKKRYYRSIFDRYDHDNDGYINIQELDRMIQIDRDVSRHVAARIHNMADTDGNGQLDFDEFVQMLHNPTFANYFNRYINIIIPRVRTIDEYDSNYYEEQYSCCPPALGMLIISTIELILYGLDDFFMDKNSKIFTIGPIGNLFVYDPKLRYECWRYLTYMFVHIGHLHLVVNLMVQLLLGVPLEMVHGWKRVLIVYSSGVIAGSLGTSITDPYTKLAGASGGVYAIITAHIATIIMNWNEMTYPFVQLLIFLTVTGIDVGNSIYNRYYLNLNERIGYMAHFSGGLFGLLVGIIVLKNFNIMSHEKYVRKISLILCLSLIMLTILINLFWINHFPKQL